MLQIFAITFFLLGMVLPVLLIGVMLRRNGAAILSALRGEIRETPAANRVAARIRSQAEHPYRQPTQVVCAAA